MDLDKDQQPCSSRSSNYPGSSDKEPGSSKNWRRSDPRLEKPCNEQATDTNEKPSTSRAPTVMRKVEWDTLERNWSGQSSSGSSWRVTNRPPAQPPKSQYYSKKGKGIGKGRRNYERATNYSSSNLFNSNYNKDTNMAPGYKEEYSMELSPQIEPMDLSINDAEDSKNFELEIDEPFEDTVAIAGQSVSLTCKVKGNAKNYKWFRNGQEIAFNSRVQALVDKEQTTFTLKINEIARHDHGIYKFEVSNRTKFRLCRGKLFVGVDARCLTFICTGLCPRYALDVNEQLKHVTVYIGDSFEISATFKSERTGNFRWFKNERVLLADRRCIISSTENNSTLNVMGSKITDTGIYIVVVKTIYGITSSWTDVQVFDNVKLNRLKNYESAPYIEEMPIDTEAHEGEEIRLLCKVRSNYRSEVKWRHFDKCLKIGDSVQVIDYGDSYLGMRIQNVQLTDSGKYGIQLRDKLTGEQTMEVCNVSVFRDHWNKEEVKAIKLLPSFIMVYGATLTLDCKFEVSRCKRYFVFWYIGHHKVTLTDSRFKVECKNGVCLLKILKMEPGMTGEAVCELRTPLSNGKSVVRAFTTCNLAIVPSCVLLQEISLRVRKTPSEIMWLKYSKWSYEGLVGTADTGIFQVGFHVNQPSLPINYTLFYMEYCRLEDDNYYYLNVNKQINDGKLVILSVHEGEDPNPENPNVFYKTVKIEWEYQGSKTPSNPEIWYRVDYQMPDGYYMPTAITSRPRLVFNNPRINESAKFRIITMEPDEVTEEAEVSITNRPDDPHGLPANFIPRPIYEYSKRYQDKPGTIGAGAYGSVCIARRLATGMDYAVKTIIFKSFEHKETCSREFQLLRSLRHEKIVMMVDAYRDDRQAKLVMEYLWGGELFQRIIFSSQVFESDVITYVRQICDALIYLHDKNIVHLDLKPENIMCVHPNSRQIKLVDFGLARRINPGYRTMVLNGTRNYVSPEVLNYDQLTVGCDLWSFGVVTYMLLSGIPPFIADTWLQESVKIVKGDYNYEDRAFRDVSELAKDFIDKLLVVDVNKRWTAKQAREHRWLLEGPDVIPTKNLKKISTSKSRWQVYLDSDVELSLTEARRELIGPISLTDLPEPKLKSQKICQQSHPAT